MLQCSGRNKLEESHHRLLTWPRVKWANGEVGGVGRCRPVLYLLQHAQFMTQAEMQGVCPHASGAEEPGILEADLELIRPA